MLSARTLAGVCALSPAGALGQSFSFEPPLYPGSPGGSLITGVDGWYVPPLANTAPGYVYTYTGNTPGLIAHPAGGQQFEAGFSGNGMFARAQHDLNFSSGGTWMVEFDAAVRWMGPLPAGDFIGSWSLQDSTVHRTFIAIMGWGQIAMGPAPFAPNHTATATNWHQGIGYYTAAAPTTASYATPSPSWRNLLVNTWYRVRIKWSFDTNTVLECGIQNLTGGGPMEITDVSANGWHLRGGPASPFPLPTGIRLFAGNNALVLTPANLCAFDNVKVWKVCYPDCNTDGSLTIADFGCFQTKFVQQDPYADCNGVGGLTIADFGCFQTAFVGGCP